MTCCAGDGVRAARSTPPSVFIGRPVRCRRISAELGGHLHARPRRRRMDAGSRRSQLPQLYRLLDSTNKRESISQLVSLLYVLNCDVHLIVKRQSAHRSAAQASRRRKLPTNNTNTKEGKMRGLCRLSIGSSDWTARCRCKTARPNRTLIRLRQIGTGSSRLESTPNSYSTRRTNASAHGVTSEFGEPLDCVGHTRPAVRNGFRALLRFHRVLD